MYLRRSADRKRLIGFFQTTGITCYQHYVNNLWRLYGLQSIDAFARRVERIKQFFETWRSNDAYDREAITRIIACTARFPGQMLKGT